MQLQTIYPHQCGLGEGAYWHAQEQRFYWVDIRFKKIHCYDPAAFAFHYWDLPGIVGCLVPCVNGGLIIGFEDKIAHFDTSTRKLKILFDSKSGLRMNDGLADPAGRFWVGQVDDEFNDQAKLFRFDPNGQCRVMEEGLSISNGLDWDLKRGVFYLTDSLKHVIYQYDYDDASGTIQNRRQFITFDDKEGFPDGFTLDQHGNLWSCMWDGYQILKISPEAQIEQRIEMPVARPTKCSFGGKHLKTLYVTTAAADLTDELQEAPAGYVFSIDVDVSGREANLFKM